MPTYEVSQFRTYKLDDEGERIQLANFSARISKEVRIVDGMNTETILTIEGDMPNRDNPETSIPLPPVEVSASAWNSLQWVMQAWGVRAIIQPGANVKADLCTAIQLNSKPKVSTIYKSIGWMDIGKTRAYLHAGGAIKAKGNDPTVSVRLPQELRLYNLDNDNDPGEAFRASLQIINLADPAVTWPLWAATFAPLYGPCDFAMHLTGRTGTFKSELCSLFQSHYGEDMDARHLPGSWSSTGNALEAQAYHANNALFVIDDFVPTGTSWQIRAYQTTADKIIRSQGNQAGRARLTDTSSLQTAYYPRGIILSTGEDTPEGHSVRARMMILELSPGDIDPAKLTANQANRSYYSAATADLISYLCTTEVDLKPRADAIRNANIQVGHTRTPPMIGRLIASAEATLDWAAEAGHITKALATQRKREARTAILAAGAKQQSYLENADPVEVFAAAIRQVLGAGQGHMRTLNGGVPLAPATLGWTSENSQGDLPTWKSHGPCIGWVDWTNDAMYLEINVGFNVIKKVAGADMSLSKQTLFKRMKDAGVITRTDDARQRNSIRVTAENHPRQVLALAISTILETQEVPNGDEIDTTKPGSEIEGDPEPISDTNGGNEYGN
jgi:hypothetical protein